MIADPAPQRRAASLRLPAIIGFTAAIAVYVLRLDSVVGLTIDDAWYVLLARALAQGQGYSIINSPTPGILPLYPPGFPLILSVFYRLLPDFPENLWLLKSISIVSMLGAGWLTLFYLRRDREVRPFIALGIALATMFCPPLVFLATGTVMSECFFTLLLIATVVVIERSVAANRQDRQGVRSAMIWISAGAVLASYAWLTRSIAVALVAAVILYLIKERLIRQALLFAALVALLVGPWTLYSRAHAPTPEQQREQGGHIIQPYTEQFWQRVASDTASGRITPAEIPARVWHNILEVTGRDALHITAAPIFENMRDAYEEARKLFSQGPTDKTEDTLIISFLLSLLMLAGFLSAVRERVTLAEIALPLLIAVTVLWPWETLRFMLPLTPFLFFYLMRGLGALTDLLKQAFTPAVQTIGVILLLGVNLYGNLTYLSIKLSNSAIDRPQWLQSFDDTMTLFGWVERTIPKDETLVTLNPPLVYLYTGRKTVAWEKPGEKWEMWKRLGIRHLVWFSAYPVPAEPGQSKFPLAYRQGNLMDYRVVDLGPPENRLPW